MGEKLERSSLLWLYCHGVPNYEVYFNQSLNHSQMSSFKEKQELKENGKA